MRRVHIIAIGDARMLNLAIALKKKGYEVSGSDIDIIEPAKTKLEGSALMPEHLGWFSDKLMKGLDYVLPAAGVTADNPEFIRAKELGLQVLSFPEFIARQTKDKTRIVISGSKGRGSILSMMIYALRKHNIQCDYVGLGDVEGQEEGIRLGYDARMVLLEADEFPTSLLEKKPLLHFYSPHILLMPNIEWDWTDQYPSYDEYLDVFASCIPFIERDGKFIYNEQDVNLAHFATLVREDVTAMPYKTHEIKETKENTKLVSRFGEFDVKIPDPYFLRNLNAARLACRQLGLKDKYFYEAASEYSKL